MQKKQDFRATIDQRGGGPVPGGGYGTPAVQELIIFISGQMVQHLKTLPTIQKRPDLMAKIDELSDFGQIYKLALSEKSQGFAKPAAILVKEILNDYNVGPIGDENVQYCATCLQQIMKLFITRVFNDKLQ